MPTNLPVSDFKGGDPPLTTIVVGLGGKLVEYGQEWRVG